MLIIINFGDFSALRPLYRTDDGPPAKWVGTQRVYGFILYFHCNGSRIMSSFVNETNNASLLDLCIWNIMLLCMIILLRYFTNPMSKLCDFLLPVYLYIVIQIQIDPHISSCVPRNNQISQNKYFSFSVSLCIYRTGDVDPDLTDWQKKVHFPIFTMRSFALRKTSTPN